MISKSAQYALRAVTLLAGLPMVTRSAREIAREIGAPENYMGKLMKQLSDAGVLHSTRGAGGGFRLARAAVEITLYEVVDPIDHVSRWSTCFLGAGTCGSGSPCAIHTVWGPIRERYLSMLTGMRIADIKGVPQGALESIINGADE